MAAAGPRTAAPAGARLVCLMGASGSGKDSVLQAARQRLDGEPGIVFAHRYITRTAGAGGENHVALTAGEFAVRRAAGCFALWWESHGLGYGIGREIDLWMDAGLVVVINGSREHFSEARARYPAMHPVQLHVAPDILRCRLQARGRETGAELEERLAGGTLPDSAIPHAVVIDNSGELAAAADALVTLLRAVRDDTRGEKQPDADGPTT